MHTPSMVLHVRGLRGDHEEYWRVLQACLEAAHRSMAICRKWAMGTFIMLAYCMRDGSCKGHLYPPACEHDDDTVAEELFGMLS